MTQYRYQPGHAPYTVDLGQRCDYCGDHAIMHCADIECGKNICALHNASFGAEPTRLQDGFCLDCYDKWLESQQEKK